MATSALQYQVRWRRATDPDTQWSSAVAVGPDGAVGVPGLQRVNDYVFQARARSGCGAWSAWAIQLFNNPALPLPGDAGTVGADGGPGGVTVTWGTGEDGTPVGIKWQIERAPAVAPYAALPPPENDASWAFLATVTDQQYIDTALAAGDPYWYRVRAVNADGSTSAWVVVNAPAQAAVVPVPEAITDAINQLNTDVAAMDGRVDDLADRISDTLAAADWDASTAYAADTIVKSAGKLYRAQQAVPAGTAVTDTAYWQYIGDYTSVADAIAGSADALRTQDARITTVEGETTANANAISSVQARMPAGTDGLATQASVNAEASTRASETGANANAISAVNARMPGGTGALATQASVNSEASTRANADSALSSSITQVQTTANNAQTSAQQSASAVQSMQTSVDALTGRANATWNMVLDVNGYVSGVTSTNSGTYASFAILADVFSVVAPGGGARTEFSGGNWRVYDASGVLRVQLGVF